VEISAHPLAYQSNTDTGSVSWGQVRVMSYEGLEREKGFEPSTTCLEGRYSTSLSYSRSLVPILAAGMETVKRADSSTARPGR
jgi:hypothetical protein